MVDGMHNDFVLVVGPCCRTVCEFFDQFARNNCFAKRSSNVEFGEIFAKHFSPCIDKTRRLD
jgi:hypothetical protein